LPELPDAMAQRFQSVLGLSAYDAGVITASRPLAQYFETLVLGSDPKSGSDPSLDAKLCANWLCGELSAALHRENLEVEHSRITPAQLSGLLVRIQDGTISGKTAKEVFEALWQEGGDADAIIEAKGLRQISDDGALEKIVDQLIAENAAQVAEYRAGKDKVFGFFVGRAMRASGGRANPVQLNDILKKKLAP